MKNVLVIHGPNLNMLGQREPDIYGRLSLNDINEQLKTKGTGLGLNVNDFQHNSEAEIITRIQQAREQSVQFIIINAGAFTHSSIAIRDALLSVNIPFIEVHLSNIFARESFRHHSYLADKAVGIISGLGVAGYHFALDYVANFWLAPAHNSILTVIIVWFRLTMDIRKIKKLLDLMVESDLQSIEVKEGDQSIALTRRIATGHLPIEAPTSMVPTITSAKGPSENAPMVGTFYTAASPGEPTYVQVGQRVSIGDTLGIIEAMKIMNPIEATHNGVITEILAANGEVVQFGQPLFRYKT